MPAHARPELAPVAARRGGLAGPLARAGRALLAALGRGQRLQPRSRVFFSKMAVVTFGGAYAVLAYVAQQAVEHYGWLTPGEMLDGLGMAETTPGPLIMVVQFVGFMAAYRDPGALPPMLAGDARRRCSTTWVTFVPCFLWIFLGAPFIEQLRGNRALERRAVGDHRGGGRRHPQPRDLVRPPHAVRRRAPSAAWGFAFDAPVLAASILGRWCSRSPRRWLIFRFKARHDPDARACAGPAWCFIWRGRFERRVALLSR